MTHVKMVEILRLRYHLDQSLQTMLPTEELKEQMLYLGMERFNVKTVRVHLIVVQLYGITPNLNIKV